MIHFEDDKFKIIDHVPTNGYEIWNIPPLECGKYVPFCRKSMSRGFSGSEKIDADSLLAVPLHIVKAYAESITGREKLKKALSRYLNPYALYITKWDNGIEIVSEATVNLETKEVKIGKHLYDYDFDNLDLEILDCEYIDIHGIEYPCCRKEYLADDNCFWYE